jgi:pyruvate formate lyase activating enzyme
LNYGKYVSLAVDPIEKKPLFHFYPGKEILSIGTIGCNLFCKNCQNSNISFFDIKKVFKDYIDEKVIKDYYKLDFISPSKIIDIMVEEDIYFIAATYNEPTVFYEYMFDIFSLAKKRFTNNKNVIITNGFINKEPLKKLIPLVDAANVDLKSFNNNFYINNCGGSIKPVLDTIKYLFKSNVWVEITFLMIPGLNDSLLEINNISKWIIKELDNYVPLHINAFYPCHLLKDIIPTSLESLDNAFNICKKNGLKYVYIGNTTKKISFDTFCFNCAEKIIIRDRYNVKINIPDFKGICKCKSKIEGIFSSSN